MECLVLLFGYERMVVAGRTVTRSDAFAQASLSHLGKTNRNTPRFILDLSLKRRALILSEVLSRSSERGSPKRELLGA